jgi:hypothetical protein
MLVMDDELVEKYLNLIWTKHLAKAGDKHHLSLAFKRI